MVYGLQTTLHNGVWVVHITIILPVQIMPYLHQITRIKIQIAATTSTTADTAIPATRTRTLDDPEVGSAVCSHEGRQNKFYLVCEPDCEPLSLQNITCGTHGCCTCTVNIIIIVNIHNQWLHLTPHHGEINWQDC